MSELARLQLAKHRPRRFPRKWWKRQTAKLVRRLGKRLLEDAPQRVTRGWTD
jgi:hypothetical protein